MKYKGGLEVITLEIIENMQTILKEGQQMSDGVGLICN